LLALALSVALGRVFSQQSLIIQLIFGRHQRTVLTAEDTAEEILFDVHLRLSEMDAKYEMEGKNIDEDS